MWVQVKNEFYIYIYIYDISQINIPGTSDILHPGNYNCDSSNILCLLMCCNKRNYGDYVGETSTRFRLRINNHKKSIRDNHNGLPVAVHYDQTDHSINVLSWHVFNWKHGYYAGWWKSASIICSSRSQLHLSISLATTFTPFLVGN